MIYFWNSFEIFLRHFSNFWVNTFVVQFSFLFISDILKDFSKVSPHWRPVYYEEGGGVKERVPYKIVNILQNIDIYIHKCGIKSIRYTPFPRAFAADKKINVVCIF